MFNQIPQHSSQQLSPGRQPESERQLLPELFGRFLWKGDRDLPSHPAKPQQSCGAGGLGAATTAFWPLFALSPQLQLQPVPGWMLPCQAMLGKQATDVPSLSRTEVLINTPQGRAETSILMKLCKVRRRRSAASFPAHLHTQLSSAPLCPEAFLVYGKSHYFRIRLQFDSYQRLWSLCICLTLDLSGAIKFNKAWQVRD